MITITITIKEDSDGITLGQFGSASPEGASKEECRAGDIISQRISEAFSEVKTDDDIEDVMVPYTRIQKKKS